MVNRSVNTDLPDFKSGIGHDSGRAALPRAIRLLDHVVTHHAPGGPGVVRKKNRRSGGRGPQVKPACNPVVRNALAAIMAQPKAVREILCPNGTVIRREVAQFCLSLLLLIRESYPQFFDLPLLSQLSVVKTASSWSPDSFVKKAKALTVWPFAYFTNQDLPEIPNPTEARRLGFNGRCARFIRNLYIARRDPKNRRFFWGLLQGVKRGCATINEEFVNQSYAKHREALTKTLGDISEEILADSGRIARTLWNGARSREEFSEPPSNSASFRSTRRAGGKQAEIQHNLDHDQEIGLEYHAGELRRACGRNLTVPEALRTVAQNDNDLTRVVMVLEPLKARPITAGDALTSYIGGIAQRDMWNHLFSHFPCFRLIGTPLDSSFLTEIDEKSPEEFDSWVSGDYSAATDNLDIRVTKEIFEAFLNQSVYSDELKAVLRTGLYEQMLVYPDGTRAQQTNGQLMGSPTSFPVLCVANLIGYVRSWEKYFGVRLERYDQIPVLINGDDILFKANQRFYQIWQDEIRAIGFQLSVGKSYFSSRFCTVNSKLYWISNNEPKLVTFFNPSQLLPKSWIIENSSKRVPDDFVGRLSDALRRTIDHRYVVRAFLSFNRDEARLATRRGLHNLFIASHLGGLGVYCPDSLWEREKQHVTLFQRRLARVCKYSGKDAVRQSSRYHVHGFNQPCCSTHAVRATVPPKPVTQPTLFNNWQVESDEPRWIFPKLHVRSNDKRMLTLEQIRSEEHFVLEIAPTEENEDLLIDIEYGQAIGLPFGNWVGDGPGNWYCPTDDTSTGSESSATLNEAPSPSGTVARQRLPDT